MGIVKEALLKAKVRLAMFKAKKALGELENADMTAAVYLTDAIKDIQKANPTMKFSEAFSKAQQENPDLTAEYAQGIVAGRKKRDMTTEEGTIADRP